MTIEEEFFKCFGIEAKVKTQPCYGGYQIVGSEYPEITAEILLKLIVIVTNYVNYIHEMIDVEDLKKSTLEELIEISDKWTVKQQVKSLFEEEGE